MSVLNDLATPQIHERELLRYFGSGMRFSDQDSVLGGTLVCLAFSNRCGSNLLAGYLRDTPCFSGFHEQLNFDTVKNLCDREQIVSFPEYFRHLSEETIAEGRQFGVKASWDQLMMLRKWGIDRMFANVHVVHMVREDVIGQAISLMIADQTKQWTSSQTPRSGVVPKYRSALLHSLLGSLTHSEQMIRILCEIYELPRLSVTYEDVVREPACVVSRIAAATGADLRDWRPKSPHISRQANETNDRFRKNFLAELNCAGLQ